MPKLPWSCLRLRSCAAGALALTLSLVWTSSARADAWYRWVTEDSVISFTDDARRIPERYRERAVVETRTSLSDYERYTPTDRAALESRSERLSARLERLRTLNTSTVGSEEPTRATPPTGQVSKVTLRAGEESRPTLELGVAADGEAPIVVEVKRLLDANSLTTRHMTVVRQGDRILSIVDPRKWTSPPSEGFLQDLEEGRR